MCALNQLKVASFWFDVSLSIASSLLSIGRFRWFSLSYCSWHVCRSYSGWFP